MSPVLQVNQLSLSIADKSICERLDWRIEPEQIWGVLGVNGVGKSTLLRALAGLHPINQGEILLNGQPLTHLNRREVARRVGLVFQHQDDIFPTTVLDQVMMGRHPHTTLLRGEGAEDRKRVEWALEVMELNALQQRTVQSLSGGERRRVAIATILAQQPQLYLLDEPEAHLDPKYQQQIFLQLTESVRQQAAASVMVLHDINLAMRYCTHLLLLFGHGEVAQGGVEVLATSENMDRLYDTGMVQLRAQGRVAWLPL